MNIWDNHQSVSPPLTLEGFIESSLKILGGTREEDARSAFKSLGGFGFSAKRKAKRLRIWSQAMAIADRVGHGDRPAKMICLPDMVYMSLSTARAYGLE